jgi:hypothetical protein
MIMKILKKRGSREKGGEEETKFMPHAPVVRSRKLKKDRQCNSQKKKDKQ